MPDKTPPCVEFTYLVGVRQAAGHRLRPRQGIGRALLSQLFVNLRGLQVERVETIVATDKLDLLGFFYAAGMRPAERLAFVKTL